MIENKKKHNRIFRIICIVLIAVVAFKTVDFALSEITDQWAYEDAVSDEAAWTVVYEKILNDKVLTEDDYEVIFSQSGLGKPAVDALITKHQKYKIEQYHDYYVMDKDYYCYRKGVFACHENITDTAGERIFNPDFADLQKGDIIITLSIHSLGWRHGHATIITDPISGKGVQAVMLGEKSGYTYMDSWSKYPLVAVLRPKNADKEICTLASDFAESDLTGLYYSLLGGIFTGRDENKAPLTTQCAHLVWYAYYRNGVDIAPYSGRIITPLDFLKSDELEIVQVYGNITDLK